MLCVDVLTNFLLLLLAITAGVLVGSADVFCGRKHSELKRFWLLMVRTRMACDTGTAKWFKPLVSSLLLQRQTTPTETCGSRLLLEKLGKALRLVSDDTRVIRYSSLWLCQVEDGVKTPRRITESIGDAIWNIVKHESKFTL